MVAVAATAAGLSILVRPWLGHTAAESQWQALPRSQAEGLLPVLAEAVRREGDPEESRPRFELTGGGALELRTASGLRVIAPVVIRYADSASVNCRLAVYTAGRGHGAFVPLPLNASYDSCRGMERLGIGDVNQDGIPDLIYKVFVPSNRTGELVWEGAVYLSRPDAEAPYCFAPDISRTVTLYKPPGTVEAFIAAEVKRRGPKVLDCYTPSK